MMKKMKKDLRKLGILGQMSYIKMEDLSEECVPVLQSRLTTRDIVTELGSLTSFERWGPKK